MTRIRGNIIMHRRYRRYHVTENLTIVKYFFFCETCKWCKFWITNLYKNIRNGIWYFYCKIRFILNSLLINKVCNKEKCLIRHRVQIKWCRQLFFLNIFISIHWNPMSRELYRKSSPRRLSLSSYNIVCWV